MKHLKIFENFNEDEIRKLCKKYNIENYTINKDGLVDVDYVNFSTYTQRHPHGYKFDEIPIKFGKINGDFVCHHNNLTTLKNSPEYIIGNFYCDHNKLLTTLTDGPKRVNGKYYCNGNNLKDVYGFPESFHNDLHIEDNPVQEIVFLPIEMPPHNAWSNFRFSIEIIIKFINLLNDYTVIRNQNTIIKDRLEESLYGINIKIELSNISFKHYKLI